MSDDGGEQAERVPANESKALVPEFVGGLLRSFSDDSSGWYEEVGQQTDRGAAVLAMSAVEEAMKLSLSARLIDSNKIRATVFDEPAAPLATSSCRRKMLVALGIIPGGAAKDIKQMAEIRNTFAHTLLGQRDGERNDQPRQCLSFDSPRIAKRCSALQAPDRYLLANDSELPNLSNAQKPNLHGFPIRPQYMNSDKSWIQHVNKNLSNRQRFLRTAYLFVIALKSTAYEAERPKWNLFYYWDAINTMTRGE